MAGNRILIVDDNREVSQLFRSGLESLGKDFQISDFLSAEEALLEFSQAAVDLLIADVRLPGISGLELMNKCKAFSPKLKVILISGVTDPKIRQQVAEAGADAFFFKPVEIADFLDAVERVLGMVDTMLPSELEAAKNALLESETQAQGLAERIASLRQELNAKCVLLLGDHGQVLVRAGELPDNVENTLIPNLMTAHSAGVRISNFLEAENPDTLFCFNSKDSALLLSHVGEAYALLVATNSTQPEDMGVVTKNTQAAVGDLLDILINLGISLDAREKTPEPAAEAIEESPEDDSLDTELEDIFEKVDKKKIKKEDADAFWASLAEKDVSKPAPSGDALTYEQARQLGLAPTEDAN
jgi:FixJ family two-component response regulator